MKATLRHSTRDGTITNQLVIMSIEIIADARCNNSKKRSQNTLLSDPAHDQVLAIAYCIREGGLDGMSRGGVLSVQTPTLGLAATPRHLGGFDVPCEVLEAEEELFSRLIQIVQESEVDLLIGYETLRNSLGT